MENQAKVKILLVEDDEDDYILTQDVINEFPKKNYALTWIDNYHEASKEILKSSYDVYLIDYRLGGESGLDLVKEAIYHGINRPFIMLTGQQDLEIDEQARKAGAVDYLIKGRIDAHQLERSIRYAMQNSENLKKIRLLNEELEQRVAKRTQDLADANEALIETQQLYQSIANNFPDGVIQVLDRELNYLFVDGTDFYLFGLPKNEIIGKNVRDLVRKPQLEQMLENFLKAFAGEKRHFEVSLNNSLGLIYECSAVPLFTKDDLIQQILVVCRNVTQKKRAEREIQNALAKEKQLGELKSRFVTTASHEFRTPLSTILSSVSLIDRYSKAEEIDNEKLGKHVQRIKTSVNNLNQILTDFLSMGQLEEGRIAYQPSYVNVADLVEETIAGMRSLLKTGQEIDFEYDCQEEKVQIEGVFLDKQILRNVLINLLSNAIKYSPEASNILLKITCVEKRMEILVKDYGIGIPQADLHHIFERFFRANNAVNIQGTGLGLNIVKRYVELLGGEISFTSEEGHGTEFLVKVPLED